MPKPCAVCAHLDRAIIDHQLARHTCNVAAVAREYGLKRMAVVRHREQHVSSFLKVYGASAILPTVGELHGELLRLHCAALDNLALAQAGTLVSIDSDGTEHRRVSPTSIARCISEARKTVDRITALAADAADENERPSGIVDGELSERIRKQLDVVVARSLSAPTLTDQVDAVSLVAGGGGEGGGTPGGVSGGAGAVDDDGDPLDAVIAPESTPAIHLPPTARRVLEADARTTQTTPITDESPLLQVPNPNYPGSVAASAEERRAAGYPDILITMDDLKTNALLVAQLISNQLRDSDLPTQLPE